MKNNFLIKLKNCLIYLIFVTQLKIIAIGNKRALKKERPTSDSQISLRDVALNFSPSGNITRDMRLRSLADFFTQIATQLLISLTLYAIFKIYLKFFGNSSFISLALSIKSTPLRWSVSCWKI